MQFAQAGSKNRGGGLLGRRFTNPGEGVQFEFGVPDREFFNGSASTYTAHIIDSSYMYVANKVFQITLKFVNYMPEM